MGSIVHWVHVLSCSSCFALVASTSPAEWRIVNTLKASSGIKKNKWSVQSANTTLLVFNLSHHWRIVSYHKGIVWGWFVCFKYSWGFIYGLINKISSLTGTIRHNCRLQLYSQKKATPTFKQITKPTSAFFTFLLPLLHSYFTWHDHKTMMFLILSF